MFLSFLHDYCLLKKGVEETFPFGPQTLVYKVLGKAFLFTLTDGLDERFTVKCDPEKALELREQYDFVLPGYHMNKKHWNTILPKSAPLKLVKEWIDDSYRLVVSGFSKKEKDAFLLL